MLPEHVARDLEFRQRFEREAKTISSLNHPHICTLCEFDSQEAQAAAALKHPNVGVIHEIDEVDGVDFIA